MLLFTGGEAGSESYRAFESIWEYCQNEKGKVFLYKPLRYKDLYFYSSNKQMTFSQWSHEGSIASHSE